MKQLSTGLPGRLKSRSTPFQYAQWSSAREVNSVLLSSIRPLSSLETEEEAQVIAEVEVVIVHPDGMLLQGNPAQLLAETRNPVQASPDSAAYRLEVDASLLGAERPRLEDLDRGCVCDGSGRLPGQVARVSVAQSLVATPCHSFSILTPEARLKGQHRRVR
jgi:hypothetical protein